MNANEKLTLIVNAIKELKPTISDVEISENTLLLDLGIDSLDAIELQMFLEETGNVKLRDSSTPVLSVSDVLKLIE